MQSKNFTWSQRIIAFTLVICIMGGLAFSGILFPKPKQAEAMWGMDAVIKISWETVQDIIIAVIKFVYFEIAREMVYDWLTGSTDKPLFISNPEQFFKDLGKSAAAEALGQLENSSYLLCPINVPIVEVLRERYVTANAPEPQLPCYDVFEGQWDFSQTGMEAWVQRSQGTENPLGFYLYAEAKVAEEIAQDTINTRVESMQNNGYMGVRVCETKEGEEICEIKTPGDMVVDALQGDKKADGNAIMTQNTFPGMFSAMAGDIVNMAVTYYSNQTIEKLNEKFYETTSEIFD
ncbi:MAG: hypothetical protein ABIE68_00465 [bacterium]